MATDPSALAEPPPDDAKSGLPFPVVGIGASAGGLEAYTEMLEALPADPGMAFLVVSHLDPDQKSHLTEILARVTRMSVREVADGMAVEKNTVYCMPAGTSMEMVDGHLTLAARPPKPAVHMPIDHLFRSLAAIQRSRAIGVILSGNGTDGALALQDIKA